MVSYVYMSVATLTANGQGIEKIQLYYSKSAQVSYMSES